MVVVDPREKGYLSEPCKQLDEFSQSLNVDTEREAEELQLR